MKKKPRLIGIVGASMGKTTAPNMAILTVTAFDQIAEGLTEALSVARGEAEPHSTTDASGLKALFDATEPIGDIDDIEPAS